MRTEVSIDPINVYNRVMSGKFYSERLAIYSERYLNKILRLLEDFDYLEGFGDGYRGPANGQRPSAGFMALLYFTKKVTSYKSLDIIGFDFFKKVTDVKRNDDSAKPYSWHLPIRTNRGGHPHNSDIEFTYANKLCQEKKINWTILSDLEPETINLSK